MGHRSKSSAENVERKLARDGLKRARVGGQALESRVYTLINFTRGKFSGKFIKSANETDVEIRPIKWDFPM